MENSLLKLHHLFRLNSKLLLNNKYQLNLELQLNNTSNKLLHHKRKLRLHHPPLLLPSLTTSPSL